MKTTKGNINHASRVGISVLVFDLIYSALPSGKDPQERGAKGQIASGSRTLRGFRLYGPYS